MAILAALLVAAILFAQAASSVLGRKNPALATQLWPTNGLAQEQLAFLIYSTAATDSTKLVTASKTAFPVAREAFANEALSPKAHGLLALSALDHPEVLSAASALNHRDLFLQGLVLDKFLRANDYPNTLVTLDRLLRVHPEQSKVFFPILMRAFAEKEALPEFERILTGGSPWHKSFIATALTKKSLLPNLAALRLSQSSKDDALDGDLILGLYQTGNVDLARQIFNSVQSKDSQNASAKGVLSWSTQFPPFDWRLTDGRKVRAQLNPAVDSLDIYVRSGSGGVVAERLVQTTSSKFIIQVAHDMPSSGRTGNLRLQLSCADNKPPFYDEPFNGSPARFNVALAAKQCATLLLSINARAPSGGPALRGSISRVEILE